MACVCVEPCAGVKLYMCRVDQSVGDRRAAETDAVSRLVRKAFGASATVGHEPSGAPYVSGFDGSVSISHSRDYACLALSFIGAVGVDVEQPRTQLRRVAPRVLSGAEMAIYGVSNLMLLRAWTLKEALYKAALTPGVDFRRDIQLPLSDGGQVALVCGRAFDIILLDEQPDCTIALVSPRH